MCKATLDDLIEGMNYFEWLVRRIIENDDYELESFGCKGLGDDRIQTTIVHRKKESNK